MRWILSFIVIGQLSACSPNTPQKENSVYYDDDYVLVEFAAKLEEDYHKIHKTSPSSDPQPQKK